MEELDRELETEELVREYLRIEPQVQSGAFRPYRQVLSEASRLTLQRAGIAIPEPRSGFLPESLPHWPPYADARPALLRLQGAGYRLGILSNVDDDLLETTLQRLRVSFDLRVTAAQVHSYKPAPGHFRAARERIGAGPWVHVAQSLYHDVAPAARLDLPVFWINREREPRPAWLRAERELASLEELAERLTPLPRL